MKKRGWLTRKIFGNLISWEAEERRVKEVAGDMRSAAARLKESSKVLAEKISSPPENTEQCLRTVSS